MSATISVLIEAAFVLAVTGAGLSPWPWTALIVGALFLLGQAVLADRRSAPAQTPEAQP